MESIQFYHPQSMTIKIDCYPFLYNKFFLSPNRDERRTKAAALLPTNAQPRPKPPSGPTTHGSKPRLLLLALLRRPALFRPRIWHLVRLFYHSLPTRTAGRIPHAHGRPTKPISPLECSGSLPPAHGWVSPHSFLEPIKPVKLDFPLARFRPLITPQRSTNPLFSASNPVQSTRFLRLIRCWIWYPVDPWWIWTTTCYV